MTVDLPICIEDVEEILKAIIARENLKNPQITYQSGSNLGEGFIGVDTIVEVAGENKILNLFVKTAPKQIKYREIMNIRQVYLTEIKFYKEIYPALNDFYKSKTNNVLDIIAKCQASSSEEFKEILVLDNLKKDGFTLHEPNCFFNEEQVKLILNHYGKYHAVSIAMKDQQESLFNELSQNLPDTMNYLVERIDIKKIVRAKLKLVEQYLHPENDNLVLEKVKYLAENLNELYAKAVNFDGDQQVIVHGDCNPKNFMFKKTENGLELRLVDFQCMKLGSPAADLSYILYAAAPTEEILANFKSHLDTYYDSLSTTVKELGSNPEQVCPKSFLLEHWKTCYITGLIMAVAIIGETINPRSETLNLVERLQENTNLVSTRSTGNEEEYAQAIKVLVKHLIENNLM